MTAVSCESESPSERCVRDAESILRAAVAAADPTVPVQRALESAPELAAARAVRVVAIGKAAFAMAGAALHVLRGRHVHGVIVAPQGGAAPIDLLSGLDVFYAAHPAPDASSVRAALAIDALLEESTEDDVVVVLVSGGASALIASPVNGVAIDEYAACTSALMNAGADIAELNTVRKHIDRLKGGGMAARAAPARVLGLVLSDVAGDPLDVIASGPLSPDPSTRADAERVLRARGVWDRCAETVRATLRAATETPKPGDPIFDPVRVAVVASNQMALDGAGRRAVELGYEVRRVAEPVTGEARLAGGRLAREAKRIRDTFAAATEGTHGQPAPSQPPPAGGRRLRPGGWPVCLLAGGETTVTVTGTGRGGRNQELVLGACLELGAESGSAARPLPRQDRRPTRPPHNLPPLGGGARAGSSEHDDASVRAITVGSIGTDGIDGPTDAAGAIAGAGTLARAARLGIDSHAALANNDSYGFFQRVGGLIRTGWTGTNVMDVQVLLIDD